MVGRWVWTGEGMGKPLLEGKVKMRADPEHARMRPPYPPPLPGSEPTSDLGTDVLTSFV